MKIQSDSLYPMIVYRQERDVEGKWYGFMNAHTGEDTGPVFCEYNMAVNKATDIKNGIDTFDKWIRDGKKDKV